MKNSFIKLAVLVMAGAIMLMTVGCKSEEELAKAYSGDPTVISPDVNITQEAKRDPELINVSGEGYITLEPDTASFYVRIYTENTQPDKCQSENASITEAVTAALIEAGADKDRLKTQEAYLAEMMDYNKTPATLVGYSMTTTLLVEVTPVDIAGKVMGAAIEAGATGTGDLSFSVSDTSGAYQQALQAAIKDASDKAKAMADALGVGIFAVPYVVNELTNNEGIDVNDISREPAADMASDAESTAMPMSYGEIKVSAKVSVSYEMHELPAA